MLIPIGLSVGVVTSLVSHLKKDKEANEVERFSQELNLERLADAVDKMTEYIGERSLESEPHRQAMRQMSSFIQGELSPQNSGLEVYRDKGIPVEGRLWYHYWVNIEGKQSNNVHLVLTNYDGTRDTGESAKLATIMSVAQSLGAEIPPHSIRFVFAPQQLPTAELVKQAKLRCLLPSENCKHVTLVQTSQTNSLDSPDGWFPVSGVSAEEMSEKLSVITHSSLTLGNNSAIPANRAAALLKAASLLRKRLLRP